METKEESDEEMDRNQDDPQMPSASGAARPSNGGTSTST